MFAYCGECWMTCYITCMLFIVRVIGVGHRWLIALPGIFTRRYLEVSLTSSNLILCGWVVVRVVVFFSRKPIIDFAPSSPIALGFTFVNELKHTWTSWVSKKTPNKENSRYGHLCCKTDAQVWIKGKSRVCWKHFWTNHIVIWQENFFLQVIGCFSLYCWNLIWVGCLLNYCRQWYPLFASLKMILRIHGGTTARYGSDVP